MSTETETPSTTSETPKPETPAPASPSASSREDGYSAAFKAMQADNARLEREGKAREKRISELEKERDALVKERDGFSAQIEGFARRDRENSLIERVRKDLPNADPLALRGVLAVLHEGGKIDRHPPAEQLEDAAKKAIELIKNEAPSLANTRPPANTGGGTNGVPARTQPSRYQGPFALQKQK